MLNMVFLFIKINQNVVKINYHCFSGKLRVRYQQIFVMTIFGFENGFPFFTVVYTYQVVYVLKIKNLEKL